MRGSWPSTRAQHGVPPSTGFDYQSCAGARAAPISLSREGAHLMALGGSTTEEEGGNPIGGRGSEDEGGGMLEPFPVFYNGGCHFIPQAPPSPNGSVDFDVLATYVDLDPDPGGVATVEGAGGPSGQLAAIVAGGCGLGRVVLCGVHVEASAELLVEQYGGVSEGGMASLLAEQLAAAERQREQLFRGIIRYLLEQS